METTNQIITDERLISYCGFYCGACPKFLKGECQGCKGDSPECAVGYNSCKVRPCCINNGYSSCAECKKYDSVSDCKDYNPLMIRFGQFITRTNRRKGIEMIKEKGAVGFMKFMIDKRWVTVKVNKLK
jgi:hypothetical protein